MKDRLLKLITGMGLTAAKFADEIGVQRSGISHILSGRNQPSYDFMLKILARYPEINTDWLMLGKGEMIRPMETQNKPVQADLFAGGPLNTSGKEQHQLEKFKPKETENNPQVTNVNSAERIVFFYPDGTYTTYFPR
jgi:transcriptional regulator with XRE-family HTH domain